MRSTFSAGIIPRATLEERIATLMTSFGDFPKYNAGLNELLATLRETARATFSGSLTYGSGEWEAMDWTEFDAVGVDLYLDARNRATYREQAQALHQYGKQVQADTITSLLEIYEAEQVQGAYIFTFMEPEMTYDPDPLYDLDMASIGIVKALPAATGHGYEETGYWEPKLAFTEIDSAYQRG